MLNNLKITIRNLHRNGIYSVINIAGLAVSLMSVIIIALWVEKELNFNKWYSLSDRLYLTGISDSDETILNGSEPLFKTLQTELPEVKSVSHFLNDKDIVLYTWEDDMNGYHELGAYVDSTIFRMLDMKFVKGSAQSSFHGAFPIVVSERLARKLFGEEDPIGKTLRVNNYREPHVVSGVFREQPKNSSFQFQWLMPFAGYAKRNADGGWNPENDWYTIYFKCCVELHPKVNLLSLNDKLTKIGNEQMDSDIFLYPISQLYLYGEFVDGKPVASKRVHAIKELSVIAIIILLIACINFMNLATARSEKRMMEMGVRKTFGAKRGNLVWQLMRESAILTISALVLALMLIWILLPVFNWLWSTDMSIHLLHIRHLCGILLIGIICTVLSGVYPAFYISAFNPGDIMKKLKNRSSNGAAWIRKGLVVFQFAASFVLICITIAGFLQIRIGQHRPLGYEKKHLLRVSNVNRMGSQFPIREELSKSVLIKEIAFANDPLINSGNSGNGYQWTGKNSELNTMINRSYVTPGYIETIALRLIEGRDFYEGSETDSRSVIINKTLANMMGEAGMINNELWVGNRANAIIYTIVGIVDDYICDDIYRTKNEPLILYKEMLRQGMPPYLYIRFGSQADVSSSISLVKTILSQYPTDKPLEYAFVEDLVNRMFESQIQEGFLVSLFSILSILVSCLGLFGLVTYVAESKTKEIGIRKIFGASVGNIVVMLTKEFLVLVTISSFVALPLAYYWINRMLQNYSYRISIGWEIFASAMLVTVVLTLITVGWQARKAAMNNPVKSLKVE